MIITCNSCEKKFVVPDKAITSEGRVVQCGSCGNKWRQYPKNEEKISSVKIKEKIPSVKIKKNKKIPKISETKIPKSKKKISKKKREVDLYSPEYLAKKHGINLNETNDKHVTKNKVSFGFYSSLFVFLVFAIAFSRILYFSQDFIIIKLPFTEYYLKYFFESIKNLFEIWKSLISNY